MIRPELVGVTMANRMRFELWTDTALRLSLFFGNSAEFWMKLQSHYDLKLARRNLKPKARRAA